MLSKLLPKIDEYEQLIEGIDFDSYPRILSYKNCWQIYFEEHLIRAVQHIFIDPKLGFSKEDLLKYEYETGLVYIYKFAEVLEKYPKEKFNFDDFQKIIPEILENCNN